MRCNALKRAKHLTKGKACPESSRRTGTGIQLDDAAKQISFIQNDM